MGLPMEKFHNYFLFTPNSVKTLFNLYTQDKVSFKIFYEAALKKCPTLGIVLHYLYW